MRVWNIAAEKACDVQEAKGAGPQTTDIDVSKCANGVYLYKVELDYGSGKVERSSLKQFVVIH